MEIMESINDGTVTLKLTGRLDMGASDVLKESLVGAYKKEKKVVLDLEKVDYVSSAGLRALLAGQKTALAEHGTMRLINVQDPVMDVFKMTGFIDILSVAWLGQ